MGAKGEAQPRSGRQAAGGFGCRFGHDGLVPVIPRAISSFMISLVPP